MRHAKTIGLQRRRRRWRVSNKVKRYSARPRLAVFRSHKHIYAQVIDDAAGRTLATASSLDKELRESVEDLREQAPINSFIGVVFSAF